MLQGGNFTKINGEPVSHQAGKLVSLPRLSLAWLLENYCGVMADKQYQLADWRMRSVPLLRIW